MSGSLPFENILLASDMDGTLITNEFKVPRRNIEAIDRFIDKGGHFTLATGRFSASAVKYLGQVKINAPAILSNGATLYDFSSKKVIWSAQLPPAAYELCIEALERFPDVGVEIYCDEHIYIVNNTQWTEDHTINEHFEYILTPFDRAPRNGQKILFAAEHELLLKVRDFVESRHPEGFYFVFSSDNYYEALPSGISKGTAVKALASRLNIPRGNIVAIGDFYNDLELVQMADFGATVKGAPKELMEAAQYVTGPCENGAVADLIEYMEQTPQFLTTNH